MSGASPLMEGFDCLGRPSVPRRLPCVLTADEVDVILSSLSGQHALLARLLYSTGMRITEALQLRVKDIDFGHRAFIIREAKGFKDRVVMLPQSLSEPLSKQLAYCSPPGRVRCGHRMSLPARPASSCHMRSRRSIPRPGRAGAGSGFSLRQNIQPIRAPLFADSIICTIKLFSAISNAPLSTQGLSNRRRRTRCATRSQRIYCSLVMTSAAYRSCSVTLT